jgi:hypothetical protein
MVSARTTAADRVGLISKVDWVVDELDIAAGTLAFITFWGEFRPHRQIIIQHRVRYRGVDKYSLAILAAENPVGH